MEGTIRKTYLLYKGYSGLPSVALYSTYTCTLYIYKVHSIFTISQENVKNSLEQKKKSPEESSHVKSTRKTSQVEEKKLPRGRERTAKRRRKNSQEEEKEQPRGGERTAWRRKKNRPNEEEKEQSRGGERTAKRRRKNSQEEKKEQQDEEKKCQEED
jgi:hypothetical protein